MPDKERFRSQTQKATLSHEEVVKAAQSYKPLASTAAERAAVKAARNKSSVNFTHDHQPTVKHRMKSHNQQSVLDAATLKTSTPPVPARNKQDLLKTSFSFGHEESSPRPERRKSSQSRQVNVAPKPAAGETVERFDRSRRQALYQSSFSF